MNIVDVIFKTMNRPDLIKKYTEETGSCFELLDKMLDFTVTNLEVLKYVEWLEGREIPTFSDVTEYKDYIKETAENVVKLRFINEVKSRMTGEELLNYNTKLETVLKSILPEAYSTFLTMLEDHSIEDMCKLYTQDRNFKI